MQERNLVIASLIVDELLQVDISTGLAFELEVGEDFDQGLWEGPELVLFEKLPLLLPLLYLLIQRLHERLHHNDQPLAVVHLDEFLNGRWLFELVLLVEAVEFLNVYVAHL